MTTPAFEAEQRRGGDAPALGVASIFKSFGATQALKGVSFQVASGDIHGLVGENGCGKSTLVKILSGVYQADSGAIELGGTTHDASKVSPAEMRAHGMRAVHQDTPIFPTLSVADNLFIGRRFPTRMGRLDHAAVRRTAAATLERFKIPVRPDQPAADLDFAVRTMVAIARELQDVADEDSGVLILDEPTAGLNEPEVEMLLSAVRGYADAGQAIMLVTHRLDEILGACDRVTVLRDGTHIVTRDREGLDRESLVSLIVGRELEREYEAADKRHAASGMAEHKLIASVRDLRARNVDGVSFDVRDGEILGLAGLEGAGCSETLAAIYRSTPCVGGDVTVEGQPLAGTIAGARRQGVALVPRDRAAEAAFSPLTVRENLSVGELARYWRGGRMRARAERADSTELVRRFDVHPCDDLATLANLSGGNQQKVMMARALRRKPKLLLLDEPSQGVDVGARAQIHHAIRAAVDDGAAVVISSSDLEELVRVCDRILVLSAGRIVGELTGESIDRDTVATLVHQVPDDSGKTMKEAA